MAVGRGSIIRATNANSSKESSQANDKNAVIPSLAGNPASPAAVRRISLLMIEKAPKDFTTGAEFGQKVEEMKKSIKKFGILEPLTVRQIAEDKFQLLSGYRRFYAAKELNMDVVEVKVLEVSDDKKAKEIFKELHPAKEVVVREIVKEIIKEVPKEVIKEVVKEVPRESIYKTKFQVISSIPSDMPDYLL